MKTIYKKIFLISLVVAILFCIDELQCNQNDIKITSNSQTIRKIQDTSKVKSKGKVKVKGKYQANDKKKCGHFVDRDGDGINDNKCSGMGIRRQKKHGEVIKNDSLAPVPKAKTRK